MNRGLSIELVCTAKLVRLRSPLLRFYGHQPASSASDGHSCVSDTRCRPHKLPSG
jgi:hypothetical protein